METSKSFSQNSDEELMDMFRQGDPVAFEILYSRYAPRVLGYLKKRLHNQQLVMDIFQETFFKLHRSRMRFDSNKIFSAWLFILCRNALIDSLRKQNRYTKVVEFDETKHPSTLPKEELNTSLQERCFDLISDLNSREQEILHLRFERDLSFNSISEKLGLSLVNVRKISSRALKRLRGAA